MICGTGTPLDGTQEGVRGCQAPAVPGTGRGTQEGSKGCQAPGPKQLISATSPPDFSTKSPTDKSHYHESGWSSDSWCPSVHRAPCGQVLPVSKNRHQRRDGNDEGSARSPPLHVLILFFLSSSGAFCSQNLLTASWSSVLLTGLSTISSAI